MTRDGQKQRGAIAILAAIVLIALGGMIALSLNMGHKASARTELQASFDAGSLAGALSFDGTTGGITKGKSVGMYVAVQHAVDKNTVALNSSDVVPGYWNPTSKTFFPFGQSVTIGGSTVFLDQASSPQYFNALKVGGGADGQGGHNSALAVILGGFFGPNGSMRVATGAVAIGGGPCSATGCTLPLAVPAWSLQDPSGATACGTVERIRFNYGHGKTVAFANLDPNQNNATGPSVKQQNQNAETCSNPTVGVGDVIQLSNGDFFNKNVDDSFHDPLTPLVCANTVAPYVGCTRYQIPVINVPDAPINQSSPVVGFVRVVLLRTHTQAAGALDPTDPYDGDASVDIYIDCTETSTGPTGCASFGFNTKKVRLVQ